MQENDELKPRLVRVYSKPKRHAPRSRADAVAKELAAEMFDGRYRLPRAAALSEERKLAQTLEQLLRLPCERDVVGALTQLGVGANDELGRTILRAWRAERGAGQRPC